MARQKSCKRKASQEFQLRQISEAENNAIKSMERQDTQGTMLGKTKRKSRGGMKNGERHCRMGRLLWAKKTELGERGDGSRRSQGGREVDPMG